MYLKLYIPVLPVLKGTLNAERTLHFKASFSFHPFITEEQLLLQQSSENVFSRNLCATYLHVYDSVFQHVGAPEGGITNIMIEFIAK